MVIRPAWPPCWKNTRNNLRKAPLPGQVAVECGTHQNFNIWVYGDEKLVRGSRLFVGETGVAANHHFLAPRDASSFRFTEGSYRLEVFAHFLGDKVPTRLFFQALEISREIASSLTEHSAGLYFDWGPDSAHYLPHVEKKPPAPDPEEFLKALGELHG